MSERARRIDTLDRMRSAHPEAENEEALTALAMASDKKDETVSGIKWIVTGVAIFAVGLIATKTVSVWLLIAMVAIVANGIRLMLNGPRIEQRYRDEALPEEGGRLTPEKIRADCGKALRVTGGDFYIVKAPLHDMGVDYDTGLFQMFSQRFFFRSPDGVYSLAVKGRQYRTAALGTEYYVVFPKSDKFSEQIPVRAYQVGSWTLSEELEGSMGGFPELPKEEAKDPVKVGNREKILPGISIALSFFAMWVPVSIMAYLCLGGFVLAVIGVIKAKNSWTTGAMMISVMSIVVTLMFVVPNLIRG